jgi:hypothetical protein
MAIVGTSEVDDHGQLNLEVDGEQIQLKRPVAYQEIGGVRRSVSGVKSSRV